MRNISLFKNFITGIGSLSLAQIIKEIRGNDHKGSVLKIRKLVEAGDLEKAGQLKKELVAFTVSGFFGGGPKMDFLKTYHPFVILNINQLNTEVIPYLFLKIEALEFTKAVFISPGGRGLKVIVEVDSEMKMHSLAYHQVCDFYEKELKINIVKTERNISRLCFMSHDPKAYFNSKSTIYKVIESELEIERFLSTDTIPGRAPELTSRGADLTVDYPQAFNNCVMEANAKLVYKQGNRNNYIYQLGVICNCAGIPIAVAIDESNKVFDLSEREIEGTIKSAYNWEPFESIKKAGEIPLSGPQTIPLEVFDKLPDLLKQGCGALKDIQERDIFLTMALSVLSGCLPEVDGVYNGRLYAPNLFVCVMDSLDNGRNSMRFARSLGTAYARELETEWEDYKEAMKKSGMDSIQVEKEYLKETSAIPGIRKLFIPAYLDAADSVFYLNQNKGSGILIGADIYFPDINLRKERSEYTYLLDRTFYHKTFSSGRSSSPDYIKIIRPKLSVAFSSTIYQLEKLIPSGDDGLFSKFMFYAFEQKGVWKDVSPNAYRRDIQSFYNELSEEVLEMIHFLKSHPTEFTLTEKQWITMNETFQKLGDETNEAFGEEALGMIHLMSLNCFRIMMVLSAVRKFQDKNSASKLVCIEDDFQVAIRLSKTYLNHGLFVYDQLEERSFNNLSF